MEYNIKLEKIYMVLSLFFKRLSLLEKKFFYEYLLNYIVFICVIIVISFVGFY